MNLRRLVSVLGTAALFLAVTLPGASAGIAPPASVVGAGEPSSVSALPSLLTGEYTLLINGFTNYVKLNVSGSAVSGTMTAADRSTYVGPLSGTVTQGVRAVITLDCTPSFKHACSQVYTVTGWNGKAFTGQMEGTGGGGPFTLTPKVPPPSPKDTKPRPSWCKGVTANAITERSYRAFQVWTLGTVQNKPTGSAIFTVRSPWRVIQVGTYHWNNGKGATAGRVGLRDMATGGECIWQATGLASSGVPSVYWVANVNITLPAGRYQVIDSDWNTWAQNEETHHQGIEWISALGAGTSTGTTPSAAGDDWAKTATSLRGRLYTQFVFNCHANGSPGQIWGVGTYSDNSSVCTAGVHAGAITLARGGKVKIEIREGLRSYSGSLNHGVVSYSRGAWPGSFVVIVT